MKTHGMLFALALSAVLTVFTAPAEALAAGNLRNSGNTALDLSRGRISGEKVDYVIELPSLWAGYLSAEREKQGLTAAAMEKIVFRYMPQDAVNKPVFLMNFYVYNKRRFSESAGVYKVLETEDFVFAHEYAVENNMSNATDKALFDRFLSEAANAEYVGGFIRPPEGQKIILSNAITINGRDVSGKTVGRDGAVYVPLREACEELGYEVGWLPKEKAVTISKDYGDPKKFFYYLILTSPSAASRGFNTVIIDGKAHVPSLFFIQILNANVEIDENYNVFINGG